MKIIAVFGLVHNEPELLCAWDEYQIDSNPQGFHAEVKRVTESYAGELGAKIQVTIQVDDSRIRELLAPAIALPAPIVAWE